MSNTYLTIVNRSDSRAINYRSRRDAEEISRRLAAIFPALTLRAVERGGPQISPNRIEAWDGDTYLGDVAFAGAGAGAGAL